MGGFSTSSILKLGLSVTLLILSLLVSACGKRVEPQSSGATGREEPQLVGIATAGKDLSKSWKGDGISEEATCFKVVNSGSSLNQLYAFSVACGAVDAQSKPFAVLEAREWIDPQKIDGPSTGEYILYSQLLPVGEMHSTNGQWFLEDLCAIDSFYRSACKLNVSGDRITGMELNAAASAERVRQQKVLEAENEGLRLDLEKNDESLAKLSGLLAKLSGQLQTQKDGVQAVVNSFEPVLQKEEIRVTEILVGKKGQQGSGVESRLATISLEVRELSEKLQAVQRETAGVTAAYLNKLEENRGAESKLEALYRERSELKKKLAAADSEEKFHAVQDELNKANALIGETALKIADGRDEAGTLLAAVKSHSSYEKEQEIAKQLANAKKAVGETLDRVALVRAKLNAIQVAKSHVATASKLLRENKVGEAAMVLPSLGKFVDRAVSIVL